MIFVCILYDRLRYSSWERCSLRLSCDFLISDFTITEAKNQFTATHFFLNRKSRWQSSYRIRLPYGIAQHRQWNIAYHLSIGSKISNVLANEPVFKLYILKLISTCRIFSSKINSVHHQWMRLFD